MKAKQLPKKRPHVKVKQPSAFDFFKRFPDERSAREYLESARWPHGITCIHCGNIGACKINEGKLYSCSGCRKQFSIRTGTVMQDSPIPIRKWLFAMYLVSTARKGISSVQLSKEIGVTQKSAWHMLGRLREACRMDGQLGGVVEIDETYIGGKEGNRHFNKKLGFKQGYEGKSVVFGARSRNGEYRAKVIGKMDKNTVRDIVGEYVARGSQLYTDGFAAYNFLEGYRRETVNHERKEYVRGEVHTNSIESFWALVKRGHYGIYHQWSKKHLRRYIDEFIFRINTKNLAAFGKDEKTCGVNVIRLMVVGMEGRILTYQDLIK